MLQQKSFVFIVPDKRGTVSFLNSSEESYVAWNGAFSLTNDSPCPTQQLHFETDAGFFVCVFSGGVHVSLPHPLPRPQPFI